MIKITLRKNLVTPDMKRHLAKVKNHGPLLSAVAEVAVSLAKGAFNTPGMRPHGWPPKKDGTPATLRKKNVLARSPRVTSRTPKGAILGSDRKYAAVHQMGSKKKNIPARPYYPWLKRKPTALLIKRGRAVLKKRLGI